MLTSEIRLFMVAIWSEPVINASIDLFLLVRDEEVSLRGQCAGNGPRIATMMFTSHCAQRLILSASNLEAFTLPCGWEYSYIRQLALTHNLFMIY